MKNHDATNCEKTFATKIISIRKKPLLYNLLQDYEHIQTQIIELKDKTLEQTNEILKCILLNTEKLEQSIANYTDKNPLLKIINKKISDLGNSIANFQEKMISAKNVEKESLLVTTCPPPPSPSLYFSALSNLCIGSGNSNPSAATRSETCKYYKY